MSAPSISSLPQRHFGAIMADPPWTFRVRSAKGNGRSASKHYGTMTLDDIRAMPVRDLAAKDCWLFLWTTWPHLPQALDVINAWGFEYSGVGFTWVKLNRSADLYAPFVPGACFVGMGYTTRKNTEVCLLARCGNPKRLARDIREVILSPRREHSRKPDDARARIGQFCPGPYLELFARQEWPGWTCWGNEVAKFEVVNDLTAFYEQAWSLAREGRVGPEAFRPAQRGGK